ncbi:hypothetical protein N7467_010388 [Penicillium canescens]|nr:hypothetical protein N7467_010388 [Penicillium canescens]
MASESASTKRARTRKSRGRGLRTTNGCLTCRKRHIKCDEVRPICGACGKNNRSCDYATTPVPRRNFLDTVVDGSISPSRSRVQSAQSRVRQDTRSPPHSGGDLSPRTLPPQEVQPQEATSQELPSQRLSPHVPPPQAPTPHARHGHLASVDLTTHQSPVALYPNDLSPSDASYILQSVTGSFSSPGPTVDAAASWWFDLLANDAARDHQQLPAIPTGYGNDNLPFECPQTGDQVEITSLQRATQVLDLPHVNGTVGQGSIVSPSQSSNAGEEEHIWQSREPIELLPREHFLFEHFVQHVSQWIDLFDPTSQFSTLVAHLAIRNAGLLNAILALACRHLSLNPRLDNEDSPNKEAALQYYYQTLHYVQRAMQKSSYMTSWELLSTTLIISAYEMLDNSSNDWERHLEGVFLIQRSQVIHGESGGLQAAVWWAWLCQDVWAAFREKRKTLTFWTPHKPLSALSPHELAARAVYITAKVINYCAEEGPHVEGYIQRRLDKAKYLRVMLDDWRDHLTIEFSPLPVSSREKTGCFRPVWIRPPAFAVAMQFYSAARILLIAHEPSLGGLTQYLERQIIIQHCVERICGIAMTLKDDASSLMSSQALFIAGIFTQEPHAREAILELLESCRKRTGWPVRSLGDELQQIWGLHEPTRS